MFEVLGKYCATSNLDLLNLSIWISQCFICMADEDNVAIRMDSNEIENKKALDSILTFYVDCGSSHFNVMYCIVLSYVLKKNMRCLHTFSTLIVFLC